MPAEYIFVQSEAGRRPTHDRVACTFLMLNSKSYSYLYIYVFVTKTSSMILYDHFLHNMNAHVKISVNSMKRFLSAIDFQMMNYICEVSIIIEEQ